MLTRKRTKTAGEKNGICYSENKQKVLFTSWKKKSEHSKLPLDYNEQNTVNTFVSLVENFYFSYNQFIELVI